MALSLQKASSSNSSNSNSTPKWKFHIFLSFRGEDTRKSFTDHLYAALCRKGLKTFRDDEELERGEVISEKLLEAIEDSLFAIVVLSKNYASSSWCLDELQKILKSRNELGQQVLPIFYGVDPSDVRHQRGSFAEAFAKHEEKFKENLEKVQKWRDSLTKVANLSGWDSKEWHEAELIENVVKALWSKLWSKLPSYNGMLVGIDRRLNAMDLLLRIRLNDVRFVGIWGMGGIGKTTLASIVYERLLDQFEICCFLSNVREVSKRQDGLIDLQKKLLSHLKVEGMVIENTYIGKTTIKNLCCNRRVLLVLDDVNSISQLENLAGGEDWFGAGSRVIVTTRDNHLLKSHGVHKIYKVEIMNKDESLELFCKKAFRSEQPKEGYVELSRSVVNYAGGLPLALQVLGSFLCGRDVLEWEDTLDKLKQVSNNDILEILKISYDKLEDSEKAIFLDIACFFKMWDKDRVTHILKICGLHPTIGISLLIEKSLLTETIANGSIHIDMHDLIQEMGRSIVFQESPNDAGKRSRLWSPKDIDQVLKRNMGTEVIQGVFLPDNSQLYKASWDPEAFSKMCNLRLLIISSWNLNLHYGLKCLSSALKFLQWNGYPLEALPLGIQLDELVYLEMHDSKINQLWNGVECLEKLKFIDLSHSKYLIRTPDFFGVPNLERLILEGCIALIEIHHSLGQLKSLVEVSLKGCKNLKTLPRKLEMTSLKKLVLCGCTQVRKLPEFGENMKNLTTLDLEEISIAKLPVSLGFLTSLRVLNLKGCKNLTCLPHTFYNLKHLKTLNISGCLKFSKLPENLNENKALKRLDVSETAITEVPSSIGQLKKLRMLSFHGCKGPTPNSWILPLPLIQWFQRHWFPNKGITLTPIFNLKSLKKLNLSDCNIDDGFIPDDLGGLSSLWELDLTGNNFVNLPTGCISNLLNLSFLHLRRCPRLQSLPQSSPSLKLMDAGDCASMEPLLSDEQLWYLFGSMDECGQHARKVERSYSYFKERDVDSASLSIKDSAVTIPGSEIPLWFENQNYISVDGKLGEGSIIIEVPQSNCAREWLGFALCVVLDDLFYSTETNQKKFPWVSWYYDCVKASEDGKLEQLIGSERDIGTGIHYPHLGILFLQICKKNGSKLSLDYNKLRLVFCPHFPSSHQIFSIKCGWRVIRKEDFEEWRKTRGQTHLISDDPKDGENGMCCEVEEQGQCSLSLTESSNNESPEASITCLESKGEATKPSSSSDQQMRNEKHRPLLLTWAGPGPGSRTGQQL